MKKHLTFILLMVLATITCKAQNERRLALVIGNAEYVGKGNTLRNPVNDANDVSNKLKTLGFDVTTVLNASMLEMDDAIDAFGQKAKNYDVALFYYSGHGLQSKGDNYMMPVDAELRSEADVRYKCTPLNLLLAKLEESECPMKLVVLDACRDNPYERSWHKGLGAKGLANVNATIGTLISYATSPGRTANDGTGRNSPYTEAFLESLDTPNLSLSDFFDKVGILVLEKTNDEQTPWIAKSPFRGSFYFNKEVSPAVAQTLTPTQQPTNTITQLTPQQNFDRGKEFYVQKQYTDAANYFRKAAEQNHASAQNELGVMYETGLGVTKDYTKAEKWYRKAAEQGNDVAQFNLGAMYVNGYGVTKDYTEAVKWYRKAAEQGNANSQNNLGYMYQMGYGVTKDFTEAVKWYRKAAEQGNSYSQYNVGVMYENGYGVKKDIVTALEWYRKAAAQDHQYAKNKVLELSANSPLTGFVNGHEYVDLGLPSGTLWATCNLGASKPEEYGNYYAWGETKTKNTYVWDTYKHANGNMNKLTKYCYSANYGNNGFTDKLTALQTSDDPAVYNWGNDWRTPSKAQWEELLANTTNYWATRNDVNGWLFISKKNDQSIFLPAAGYIRDTNLTDPSSYGNYWSRSLYTDELSYEAWRCYFLSGGSNVYRSYRSDGFSVRPVHEK